MSSSNWFNEMKPEKKEKQKFFNFGLKSKKPASLALGGSPARSPVESPAPSPASYVSGYANRPPSKSVSSRDDSIGPRTPSDTNNRSSVLTHNSLLTLSDSDPFAARGVSVHQLSPHNDLNRLSKYSHISTPESVYRQSDSGAARFSYASTSSHAASIDPSPIPKPGDLILKTKGPGRSSSAKLRRKPSNFSSESSLDDAWESLAQAVSTSHPSGVRSNGTEDAKLSQAERPHTRARGLTESSATRPGFSASEAFIRPTPQKNQPVPRSAPVSPRVIIRQASQPRLTPAPTTPLPASPVLDKPFDDPDSEIFSGSHPASSSNFSLSTPPLFYNRRIDSQDWSPRAKEGATDDHIEFASFHTGDSDQDDDFPVSYRTPVHSPVRTLKKALSQQSLRKPPFPAPTTPVPSPATSTPPLTPSSEKSIKKQRSFHHPKIPLPPIPSALRNQGSGAASAAIQSHEPFESKESKRGSALSTSSRKRLFSGSGLRRPSTASSIPNHTSEDDSRSIFSVQSDSDHHRKAAPSLRSVLRDDVGSPDRPATSSGITSSADYTPQRILSPADMYIIEASMSAEPSPAQPNVETQRLGPRARGLSASSPQAMLSEESTISFSATLAPSNISVRSHRSVGRVPSNSSLGPKRHVSRTSQSLEDLVDRHDRIPSPPPQMVSLPPPPRPRRGTTTGLSSSRSNSIISNMSAKHSNSDRHMPLSPPPPSARSNRIPPSSIEKALHRRSIMRKPSFLEIDDTDVDDDDSDAEVLTPEMKSAVQPISSSFLDLARESFDTVR